jgi:hypothetical protein
LRAEPGIGSSLSIRCQRETEKAESDFLEVG